MIRDFDEDLRRELQSVARAVVGDHLRSLTVFDPDEETQVYLRSDLERDADLTGFADTERLGFRSRLDYGESELGEYRFTARGFERGYLSRVIVDDRGVFVTCDEMPMERFRDLATSLREVLAAH